MAELRQPSITKVTNNVQVRSRKVLISSYGAGKIHTGITMDGVDLDTYVQPGVARVSANYTHGPSIENQPGYIIVHAVNQDEERDKPQDAVTEDSDDKKADTSSWKGRYRYRQLYFPDSGADNTPYTRTGSKDEPKEGEKDSGKITWGSWSSIAGSKIDQQLSSHEGRITILEMNTMMYSRHDFVTTQWVELKHNYKLIPSGYEGFNTIPEDIENSAPMMQVEQEVDPVSGEVKKTAGSLLSDTNKKYTHTFVTNHYTHTHVYKFENSNATEGNGNNQATHGNATGSVVLMDDKVEVHILGKTDPEDIQREMQIVAHEQFNGYIITMGAITPPEFTGKIIKANQVQDIIAGLMVYNDTDDDNAPDNGHYDPNNSNSGDKGKFKWKWTDDVAVITGIKRNPANVSAIYVPATLDIDGKTYPVKMIESGALTGNPWVTRIMIGEGIEIIKHDAFMTCPNLIRVDLPKSLQVLTGAPFNGCPNLKSLTLNEGLKYLSVPGVLMGLGNFNTKLRIPSTVEKIQLLYVGGSNSNQFPGYEVDEKNQNFKTADGALYNKDYTILYDIPHTDNWSYNIYITPSTVTTVAPGVFYKNFYLKVLIIEDHVKYCTNMCQSFEKLEILYLGAGIVKANNTDDATFGVKVPPLSGGYGLGAAKLKTLSTSPRSQTFEVEDNILYNKGKKTLVWMPPSIPRFFYKVPNTVKYIATSAIYAIKIGILDLNKVEQLGAASIMQAGYPNGINPSTSPKKTSSNTPDEKQIYGLTLRFSDNLKRVETRGIYRTFFGSYFLFDDWGESNYMIEKNMLFKKNNDPTGSTQTASGDNKLYEGHHRGFITYLYPRINETDDEKGITVTIPEDVNAIGDAPISAEVKDIKIVDYSKCTQLKDIGYVSTLSSNTKHVIKLPPNLERIRSGESIHYRTNPEGTLDIPASVYSISYNALYIDKCRKITFHTRKKNGDKAQEGNSSTVTVNVRGIFGQINTDCIIRGIKGTYAEEIANQYTLKFEPVTEEQLKKEEEEAAKTSS